MCIGEEINEHRPNVTNTRPPVGSDKLSNKKILFVGDSHMRGMADLFLYHVCKFKIEHLAWNRTYIELERTDEQPRATYLERSVCFKNHLMHINKIVCFQQMIQNANYLIQVVLV